MPVNEVGPEESWRLVYTDTEVMLLEKLHGFTTTQHNLFEAATEKECLDKIAKLGLIYITE